MSVLWIKVWSDLWHHKTRTALVVLSIASGLFAMGAMFGMADLMSTGMAEAHQETVPAHVTMFIGPAINQDAVSRLARIDGVAGVEAGNFINIRYKLRPDEDWDVGWLIMRQNFTAQSYDQFQLKGGVWPDDLQLGVERLTSQFYGLNIGDAVILEVGSRERVLDITGLLRHPFVPPPAFGGPAVFFIDGEGLTRFDVPEGRFAQLRIRVTPYSDALARDVAAEIKSRLAADGVTVGFTNYQNPNEHWGNAFMEGIHLILQVLALVSLAASVVIIFNVLTALITQQVDQIGLIKAVGGSSGVVIRLYMAMVLMFVVVALLIALPAGAIVAFALTRFFLNFFNIDYATFQVSRVALSWQLGAAIVVPLLAGLLPVLQGARITVREAIATYGIGSDFGSNPVDRLIEGVAARFLSTPYAVTVGNLFRRKGRLILTQLVLVMAGLMFMAVMSLQSSIDFTLDNDFQRRQYDVRLFFSGPERSQQASEVAMAIPEVEQAEVWARYGATLLKDGQRGRTKEAGLGAELIGIPNGSTMFRAILIEGRWLSPVDDRAVLVNEDTAELNDIHVGDVVTIDLGVLGDADWQVIGIFKDLYGAQLGTTEPIYANLDAVAATTKRVGRGNDLYVQLNRRDEALTDAVTTELKARLDAARLAVDSSETVYELRRGTETQFSILISILLALAVIVALVGGIGLMGSLTISVVERTREIGVMRSIGAQTGIMLRMFVLEGMLQGLMSWVLAVPLAYAFGRPLSDAMGELVIGTRFDYQFSWWGVAYWLGMVLIIAALASIVPARSAANLRPRESLAYS